MANKKIEKIKFPKEIVNHYIDELEKDIKVDDILLFGSFANGTQNKNSDVDLIIVSKDFKKMDFNERLDWLQLKRDKKTFQIALDIIGYTPNEFKIAEKQSPMFSRARQYVRYNR